MKTNLITLILLCGCLETPARIGTPLSYEELKAKATLIVIAVPTKVTLTEERGPIPGSNREGKGLETTFEVATVLKGENATNTLVLHHFTLAEPKQGVWTDTDPRLVLFTPEVHKEVDPKFKMPLIFSKAYLMFLRREPDGRYVAVSGQFDPADSIKILETPFVIPR